MHLIRNEKYYTEEFSINLLETPKVVIRTYTPSISPKSSAQTPCAMNLIKGRQTHQFQNLSLCVFRWRCTDVSCWSWNWTDARLLRWWKLPVQAVRWTCSARTLHICLFGECVTWQRSWKKIPTIHSRNGSVFFSMTVPLPKEKIWQSFDSSVNFHNPTNRSMWIN